MGRAPGGGCASPQSCGWPRALLVICRPCSWLGAGIGPARGTALAGALASTVRVLSAVPAGGAIPASPRPGTRASGLSKWRPRRGRRRSGVPLLAVLVENHQLG